MARTWAPKGSTPIVRYVYKQDRISAISALAMSPRRRRLALYLHLRTHNLTGLDVRSFLRHLFRHLRGPVFLLWDRGTIHKRVEVRGYLAQRHRVHVEWFPAYAPELNPAEYVWSKNDSDLANGAPLNCRQLAGRLHNSMRRVRGSQKLLWSCIYASDLPWTR